MDDNVEYRLKVLEEDSKRNSDQHREFYAAFKALEKQNAVTEERYNTILSSLAETKKAVEDLKAKPAKRWEGLVDKLLFAVAGAVLAWLAAGAPGL